MNQPSKVAVINFSGNVGKSTVSRHLLSPRMNDARIFSVESINSDGSEDAAVRGKQFGMLTEALDAEDAAVVDVGASNVEDFINMMKQYRGSHEDFDFYVVPTTAKPKQIKDTISTIDALAELGIPPEKIRVVFNMVEVDEEDPASLFSALHEFHKKEKLFTLRKDAIIRSNDIFMRVTEGSLSIADILNDPTDYKAQLKTAATQDERVKLSRKISAKRLATGVTEELDTVFKTLFK